MLVADNKKNTSSTKASVGNISNFECCDNDYPQRWISPIAALRRKLPIHIQLRLSLVHLLKGLSVRHSQKVSQRVKIKIAESILAYYCSSYDKYYDNLTKIYFSACWLVRADL